VLIHFASYFLAMSTVIPINEKDAFTAFDLPDGSEEVIKFLQSHPGAVSFLNKIPSIIRDIYGNVRISLHIHTDPEEGWERLVLTIFSGINGPDELTQREDALFNRLAQDDALSDGLEHVVLSQG
jgi:hypothetical protein